MSFLHPVRLSFAGTFQADVSTVNNDVRHYDNAAFEPAYQDLQEGQSLNGWWNPNGSGAFRLIDCRVTGVWYGDGASTSDPGTDPVVGAWIGGSAGRTSGKLVDIDPQWQLASAPWGLEVRLTDGARDLVAGRYEAAAFRDLWFTRVPSPRPSDRTASATFQSVLDELTWGKDALKASRFLRELHAASTGRLSMRFATFGYDGDVASPGFTLGTVVGAIGPQRAGEATSFVAGRRFTPASGFSSWNGITYFGGVVDKDSQTLLLDLSNALTITDAQGSPSDIGTLTVGILRDPATAENTPVTTATLEVVAEIPYRNAGWLQATGGVFAAPLKPEQLALAGEQPLALVTRSDFDPGTSGFDLGTGIVAIRESAGGLYVCAEPAVHRLDAGDTASFTVHASRYGRPLPDAEVLLTQVGKVRNQGGGSPADPHPPPAPIPDIGVPEGRFEVPASVTTEAAGTATVTIASDPAGPGNPRGYIDGQLYLVDYRLAGQSNTARQPFEYVVVHARDAVDVSRPTWEDVGPILTQYGNLYPIMSKQVVDLADPADVLRNRDLLRLAFTADMADPNHMPVTRDLSEDKRRLILHWLEVASLEEVTAGKQAPAPAGTTAAPASPAPATEGPVDLDSKTRFAAGFHHAMRPR